MPERETIERAREDAREGKSPSTQAGEFVREEIHHSSKMPQGRQAVLASTHAYRRKAIRTRQHVAEHAFPNSHFAE